ncbi:MAG: D-alanine--D-alanine ligase family protein [Caldisericia bacterium]|nr:D-alanine--D-alanine ligase family protein [Caldisericia bacterium]
MKKRVGLFFGSKSVEHEISIITAMQVYNAIDKSKYSVIPIYISKKGEWFTGDSLLKIESFKNLSNIPKISQKIKGIKVTNDNILTLEVEGIVNRKISIDIAFSVIHGTYGEDGKLQGIFEMLNVPYVGSGVLASSIGMDKVIMKEIFKANNLPIVNYLWFTRYEWEINKDEILNKIESTIKYPLFVKPANLGSSIGITRAEKREEIEYGVEIAKYYDSKIIVEEGVKNLREINCSVMGNIEVIPSKLEEVKTPKIFLDYDSKYKLFSKGSSKTKSSGHIIPAELSEDKTKEIQNLAVKAFKALDCKGIARVDFLMDSQTEKVYINEINTMPGALSFYLWEASGIPFNKLIDNLINIAFEVFEDKNKNITSIDTDVLLQNYNSLKRE